MKKKRSSIGIEYSGHYYFREKIRETTFYIDSAILAIIKLASIVSELPYTLENFYNLLPPFYYEQLNLPQRKEVRTFKIIKKEFHKEIKKETNLDGLTLELKGGWLNIRKSNTEPLLRISMGAKNKKILNLWKKKVKTLLINK